MSSKPIFTSNKHNECIDSFFHANQLLAISVLVITDIWKAGLQREALQSSSSGSALKAN